MTVLVTGGAGFIGSNFLLYMTAKYPDTRFVCIDKLTYAGNLSNLKSVLPSEKFRFVKCDICDAVSVERVFREENPDLVVNFAAESHVDRSIEDSSIFLKTNILGVQVLLDACLKHGVKRFHQISTDEVYGELPLDRPELSFTEESPLRPGNPYSASKAAADLLVNSYRKTHGLFTTVSRCSNNFGPYQFPEKLIPLSVTNALLEKPLTVYGDGYHVRDWISVYDHSRALDLILRDGRAGEIYNVGANCEMKNIDIIRLICKFTGAKESLIKYVADRKGHDLRYSIDASKIKKELGFKPERIFTAELKNTVDWYTDNREWWSRVLSGEYREINLRLLNER